MVSKSARIERPYPGRLRPDQLAVRPAVRRWARSLVRALLPLAPPIPSRRRRLLVIFLDGVGGGALRRASASKLLRFLPTLRDGRSHRESRAFSGMPSTTTSFQAGLFFGLRHPDVPAFSWFDRAAGAKVIMNAPGDAADIEASLRRRAGPGLFAGGTSYVSILAGGSEGPLSTAGLGRFAERFASLRQGHQGHRAGEGRGAHPADEGRQLGEGHQSGEDLQGHQAGEGRGSLLASEPAAQPAPATSAHLPIPGATGLRSLDGRPEDERIVGAPILEGPYDDPPLPLAAAFASALRSDGTDPVGRRAQAVIHTQTFMNLLSRVGAETPSFLANMAAFANWSGSSRHEFNFLLNHLGIGTLLGEIAKGSAILDLVRGVPRVFLNLHEYDEFSHRRGPAEALRVLRRIDREIEALFALASEVPDPPDIYVITDHGHIPSIPFEKIFGCTLEAWLLGKAIETQPLPKAIERLLGPPSIDRGCAPPRILDCGNYAHVYFGGDTPWDANEIVARRGAILARALDCPGVGLVAMRSREHGPIAFAGGRRVDPDDPSTHPRGTSPRAIAALLEELGRSPAAGDLVLYGSWLDDACVAFTWEFSSHGGPSSEETETFVLHPADLDLSGVEHGADLHAALQARYGAEDPTPTR